MTIVGLAIVTAQLWREIGPLRAEVRATTRRSWCAFDRRPHEDLRDPRADERRTILGNGESGFPKGVNMHSCTREKASRKLGFLKQTGTPRSTRVERCGLNIESKPEVGFEVAWASYAMETSQGSVGSASARMGKVDRRTTGSDRRRIMTRRKHSNLIEVIVLARGEFREQRQSSDKIEDPSDRLHDSGLSRSQ